MKRYNSLIAFDGGFLAVQAHGSSTTFGAYKVPEHDYVFTQQIASPLANAWAATAELIAALSWEECKVTLFANETGQFKASFTVTNAGHVKIVPEGIRTSEGTRICTWDEAGRLLSEFQVEGSLIADLGDWLLGQDAKGYWLTRLTHGEGRHGFPVEGLGITAYASSQESVAVCESRGAVRCFDRMGDLFWKITAPDSFHPVKIEWFEKPRCWIMLYRNLASPGQAIVGAYTENAKMVLERAISDCPMVVAFCPSLEGLITSDGKLLRVDCKRLTVVEKQLVSDFEKVDEKL